MPYNNRTYRTSGFEKHHGVLYEWAEHNILLTPETHESTKRVYREWLRENYGSPVGVSPDWNNMNKEEAMSLTYEMFIAANVPGDTIRDYLELFDLYILR